MGRKFGLSFSWKRALGISSAKSKLSRAIGIPLTRSGRQRKAGRLLGNLLGAGVIAGAESITKHDSVNSKTSSNEVVQDYRSVVISIKIGSDADDCFKLFPGLQRVVDQQGRVVITDNRGLLIVPVNGQVEAIELSFVWNVSFEQLTSEVSSQLSIPATAKWVKRSDSSGLWYHDGQMIAVDLSNGLAWVTIAAGYLTKADGSPAEDPPKSTQASTNPPTSAWNVTPHLTSIWDHGKNDPEDLSLHGRSLILATQKPKGWAHLLFAQIIIDEVEKSKSALALTCGPTELRASAISSPLEFADWCTARIDEMTLLGDQIGQFALVDNAAFGMPGQPGSIPAIISLSRPIRLFCQRSVEWAQDISNAPLDPLFRDSARELLRVSNDFIGSVDRFANELMRQLETALNKPPGGQVIIDACLKIDSPDLTRFVAAMKKLEGQI